MASFFGLGLLVPQLYQSSQQRRIHLILERRARCSASFLERWECCLENDYSRVGPACLLYTILQLTELFRSKQVASSLQLNIYILYQCYDRDQRLNQQKDAVMERHLLTYEQASQPSTVDSSSTPILQTWNLAMRSLSNRRNYFTRSSIVYSRLEPSCLRDHSRNGTIPQQGRRPCATMYISMLLGQTKLTERDAVERHLLLNQFMVAYSYILRLQNKYTS